MSYNLSPLGKEGGFPQVESLKHAEARPNLEPSGNQTEEKTQSVSEAIFNAPTSYRSSAMLLNSESLIKNEGSFEQPKIENISDDSLETLLANYPSVYDLAQEVAKHEIFYQLELLEKSTSKKKPLLPRELKESRKKFYDSVKQFSGLSRKSLLVLLIHALDKKGQGIEDKKLLEIIKNQKETLEKDIGHIEAKSQRAKQLSLKTVTQDSKLLIPNNHQMKFECSLLMGNPKSSQLPRFKESMKKQNWSEKAPDFKTLKQRIKVIIRERVSESIKERMGKYDLESLPYYLAYEDFNYLLEKLQKCPEGVSFKEHLQILNDMIPILDAYYRNKGVFEGNEIFKGIYLKVAKGFNNLTPLYHFSEEYTKKIEDSAEISFGKEQVLQLEEILSTLTSYLKSNFEKNSYSSELKETKELEINGMISEANQYLEKLIKVHKLLSYKRFIDLFSVQSQFTERLSYALEKLEEASDKQKVLEIVRKTLHPETTLLETKLHRSLQGRHDLKGKSSVGKHLVTGKHPVDLKLSSAIKVIMASDSYDMHSFECAHVIPFPAVYARRSKMDIQRKKTEETFEKTKASIEFFSSKSEQREAMVKKDIDLLYKEFNSNPEVYMDNVLEVLMKLSFEEASSTIHMPSVMNQEADGVSEKYLQSEEMETIMQTFLQKNSLDGVKDEGRAKYTDKAYKYFLGFGLFNMASTGEPHSYQEVLKKEEDYIVAVKHSIAKKMEWISQTTIHTTTLLILACSLCNIYYGLKNAEAKAGLDITKGDEEVAKSLKLLSDSIADKLHEREVKITNSSK